jgi:uncharacterized protein
MKKLLLLLVLLFFSFLGASQLLTPQQMMFPTSNGDSLEVDVYLPNNSGTFPVILIQTPYGKYRFRAGLPLGIYRNLSNSNYAFVVLDWRGRFANLSKADPTITIGEDGYDLVEWIATQPWSTGKIGTWGPSALGNIQFETAKKQPPNLTCAVPLVASPHFLYKDYYAGGSARVQQIEQLSNLGFGISSVVSVNQYFNNTWQFIENNSIYPDSIKVPMLMIGGWYDHNTDATIFQFDTCTAKSILPAGTKHHLLMGPWTHGGNGTAYVGSSNQGQLSYPNAAGINDSVSMQFFDYHLRNMNNGWHAKPAVMYYQMGDEKWMEDSQWPVSYTTPTNYYLQSDGSLRTSQSLIDSLIFSYNPTSPSPTIGGATLRTDLVQGPYNQIPDVESSFDAITFETLTHTQDLKIKGKIGVNFFISSDKKDTDVAIRITDVYPDGRSMLLMDGIQRMRFRNGFRVTDTAFMQSGLVYPVSIDLPNTAITIKTGHKLRVIVTSSNYPMYNRNMNNGGEMYPGGNLDSVLNPQFVTNKIHVGATYPSRLVLPVDNTNTSIIENVLFELEVYPNPTNGLISLATDEKINNVKLIDISGKLIMNLNQNVSQINISDLKNGFYFLVIESDKGSISKKIIKQ